MSGKESYILPAALRKQLTDAVADWDDHDKVSRLWQRDASLWTNSDEAEWLGWLDIVDKQIADTLSFETLSEEVRRQNFSDILLLGMFRNRRAGQQRPGRSLESSMDHRVQAAG